MGRIGEAFDRARAEDRAALVIYVCVGDPDVETSIAVVLAAAESGADIIELGVPFSDPTADGLAIQRASERALAAGTTLATVLDAVAEIRRRSTVPLLLFGYYNPILVYGEANLVGDAARAGVDGFLVVDLPPEESEPLRTPAIVHGLDFVPLVAPTSNAWRRQLVGDAATSFVYYVSLTGVTGTAAPDLAASALDAKRLSDESGRPVAVGFGVKTREDVQTVAAHADGVVVGTAVVRAIEEAADRDAAVDRVRALVSDLAAGTRRLKAGG
jgi:tryptophan synthase alpha chain